MNNQQAQEYTPKVSPDTLRKTLQMLKGFYDNHRTAQCSAGEPCCRPRGIHARRETDRRRSCKGNVFQPDG